MTLFLPAENHLTLVFLYNDTFFTHTSLILPKSNQTCELNQKGDSHCALLIISL